MSWFALGLKILSCNICAMNKEQYSNSNLLNPRLYEFERNHFACNVERCISCMNMIYTACRNKEIDIWCFLPGQINWTCLAQFFFLYLILKSEKKIGLELHSFTWIFDKCHNIFLDLKIYILLQKKLDNGIPYPEVRKGLVFKKPKIKSCLAYNLAAVYQ